MERMMSREDFREWFVRFSRPRAIWIQHSGWVPGTQPSPVPEATAQGHMEDLIILWADAIREVRGQRMVPYQDVLPPGAPVKVKDDAPHSRACGIRKHDHGIDCAPDCPTCNPPVHLGYLSLPADVQADIENQMGERRSDA